MAVAAVRRRPLLRWIALVGIFIAMTGDLPGRKSLARRHDIPIIIYTGCSEKLTDVSLRSRGFAGIAV